LVPTKPLSQTQVPLSWAFPWPLQVSWLVYWHEEPAAPGSHVQVASDLQAPWAWQVVLAEQKVQAGYAK
jgi:hypothetical protein